jgi:hypothetical protein
MSNQPDPQIKRWQLWTFSGGDIAHEVAWKIVCKTIVHREVPVVRTARLGLFRPNPALTSLSCPLLIVAAFALPHLTNAACRAEMRQWRCCNSRFCAVRRRSLACLRQNARRTSSAKTNDECRAQTVRSSVLIVDMADMTAAPAESSLVLAAPARRGVCQSWIAGQRAPQSRLLPPPPPSCSCARIRALILPAREGSERAREGGGR